MSIGSKLKIDSRGMFATSVFYAVVGVVFLVLLPLAEFAPHVGIIGILSLATAYGVFRKRGWAFWFVVVLFFVSTTFSVFMIYSIFASDLIIGLGLIAYLIFTWFFTAYAADKRKDLET
jgi:hypothetical protein